MRNLLPASKVASTLDQSFVYGRDRFLSSRSKQGRPYSPRTVDTYREALSQFLAYLKWKGMPTAPEAIKREHVEAFLDALEKGDPDAPAFDPELTIFRTPKSAATVSIRYRALRRWFNWLSVDEEEIVDTPMRCVQSRTAKAPKVAVLSVDDLRKLLATCEPTKKRQPTFTDVRDRAIILCLLRLGLRVSECAGMTVSRIKPTLEPPTVTVTGKGNKERTLAFPPSTWKAVRAYLMNQRPRHRYSKFDDHVWLGRRGPMTASGIADLLAERSKDAGLGRIHPHQLRHNFAHYFRLDNPGSDSDLVTVAGWEPSSAVVMLQRYGASGAEARAAVAMQRPSQLDKALG